MSDGWIVVNFGVTCVVLGSLIWGGVAALDYAWSHCPPFTTKHVPILLLGGALALGILLPLWAYGNLMPMPMNGMWTAREQTVWPGPIDPATWWR